MRTTPHSVLSIRSVPSAVEASVLELLFDPVPDVTFFIKDTAGRIVSFARDRSIRVRHRPRLRLLRPQRLHPRVPQGGQRDADTVPRNAEYVIVRVRQPQR